MTEPLNPVQVEDEIRRLINDTAAGVAIVTSRLNEFRKAEREYDVAYARAYLDYHGPAHERKFAAELATASQREARDVAEVAWKYAEGRSKAIERQLSGYQTLNRGVVQMYGAAGVAGQGG